VSARKRATIILIIIIRPSRARARACIYYIYTRAPCSEDASPRRITAAAFGLHGLFELFAGVSSTPPAEGTPWDVIDFAEKSCPVANAQVRYNNRRKRSIAQRFGKNVISPCSSRKIESRGYSTRLPFSFLLFFLIVDRFVRSLKRRCNGMGDSPATNCVV